jgi:RNase adaptor protein for sRNA GlmZ degradation
MKLDKFVDVMKEDNRMAPLVDAIVTLKDETELVLLELRDEETSLRDVLEELQFSIEMAVSDLYSVYKHGVNKGLPYTVEEKIIPDPDWDEDLNDPDWAPYEDQEGEYGIIDGGQKVPTINNT